MMGLFNFVAVIVILLSALAIVFPRLAWELTQGWKYKNVEPSDAALVMTRLAGVAGVIVGIVILISANKAQTQVPAMFPWQ